MFFKVATALLIAACFLFALLWFGVGQLVAPFNKRFTTPVSYPVDPYAEQAALSASDGIHLSLWHHPPRLENRGCVLLLHGNGGSHRQFDDLAALLIEEGYGVSAIDFRGHAASAVVRRSVGWSERLDAEAAYQDLQSRCNGRKIGVIGFSLGGAAALLGNVAKEADALILDAVYKDIVSAVHVRLEQALGYIPAAILTQMMVSMAELRYGLRRANLSPMSAAEGLKTPVLAFAGQADYSAPVADSEAILDKFIGSKQLIAVSEAGHGANRYMLGPEYDRLVLEHFADHLTGSPS